MIEQIKEALEKRNSLLYPQDGKPDLHDFLEARQIMINAPTWLRWQNERIEQLEQEYAEERESHNAHVTELLEAEKRVEQLEKALEFYADASTYDIEHLGKHGCIIIDRDGGEIARKALGKE